ncbi:carbon-nitrogen hydrolase family protein [Symmachiella dynata]|uniref:carbon-nitrogen hydrolase family protein n=1 Tax=Symmachiella dynata TaxID=2527995 RepID=UPI0030EB17FD
MTIILAAVVQLQSTEEKARNVDAAARLVTEAAQRGASFVALPELFNCIGRWEAVVAEAEPISGPTSRQMSELAANLGITLLAGSIAEQSEVAGKIYNTSLLFGPDGQQLACYRKRHLFDVDVPDKVTVRESEFVMPGAEIVGTTLPDFTLGQSICYDLRFPELFRALADRQADVIAVPAAFAFGTGCDHWEVLLRARAIENQAFVIAPNQHGRHTPTLQSYGRSMIVDPWGTVLATAADGESLALAELDFQRLQDIRRHLPALAHRRDGQ